MTLHGFRVEDAVEAARWAKIWMRDARKWRDMGLTGCAAYGVAQARALWRAARSFQLTGAR